MKYSIDSINCITSDKSEKMISINLSEKRADLQNTLKNQIFVVDIDENSQFGTNESNKFSLQSVEHESLIIHPLYNINDVCIKSSIKKIKNSVAEYKYKSSDYIDIFAPQLEDVGVVGMCQLDNYAYCLTDRTSNGPVTKQTNIKEIRKEYVPSQIQDRQYSWKLQDYKLPTYIYNVSSDMSYIEINELSNYYKPKYNLTGIKYNYVIEVPQKLAEGYYNDYDAGDIQGDILQTKNVYDYKYDMSMNSLSLLENTREYIGIGTCGNKLFLKFLDNIDYKLYIENNDDINEIKDIETEEKKHVKYPFQKVEVLDSINRFRSNIRHKSPLFSVTVNNTGIGLLDEQLRNKIKTDIKNNIRIMTKQLCPATTELFDVYFDA